MKLTPGSIVTYPIIETSSRRIHVKPKRVRATSKERSRCKMREIIYDDVRDQQYRVLKRFVQWTKI